MRLSELNGKEVINLTDGSYLGTILYPEAVIDLKQGIICSLIMNSRRWFFKEEKNIPWKSLRKISSDLILIELSKKKYEED